MTFSTGRTRQCVNIPIVHDYLIERTELFEVYLINAPSYVTLSSSYANVYIYNRNSKLIIKIHDLKKDHY